MSTSLRTVIQAARLGEATLVGEMAGYVVLGAADAALSRPFRASSASVFLAENGEVVPDAAPATPDECEKTLRALLGELLACVRVPAPNLDRVARANGTQSLPTLVRELESALVPVNRKAAKRALSRLSREGQRFESHPAFLESSLAVEEVVAREPLSSAPTHVPGAPIASPAALADAPDTIFAPSFPSEPPDVNLAVDEDASSEFPTIPAPSLAAGDAERVFVQEIPSPGSAVATIDSESRDERYLTEDRVLGALHSMRAGLGASEWADEDDFMTELWAARSVRPPETFGGESLADNPLPTLPSPEGPNLDAAPAVLESRIRPMSFDSPSPLPVTVRDHDSPLPFAVDPDFVPRITVARPAAPSIDFDLAGSERPPIVVTVPSPGPVSRRRSAPLLELGEPVRRAKSDVSDLLKRTPVAAPPSAELIGALQTLSGIGSPRLPRV